MVFVGTNRVRSSPSSSAAVACSSGGGGMGAGAHQKMALLRTLSLPTP